MKDEILAAIDNPVQLEILYRSNKSAFKKEFNELYTEVASHPIAQAWNQRLNYDDAMISWGKKNELVFIIIAALIAGFIAKIPAFFSIDEDFFYPRNISFIVFPFLIFYFLWQNKADLKTVLFISGALVLSVVYINALPKNDSSDTFTLACIHLPLFLWTTLALAFTSNNLKDYSVRMDFLRYNGDLFVMMAVLLLAGGILAGITVGLFKLINIDIEDIFFKYIVIWELAAVPLVATFLVKTNPQLVNKVSPIVARIFTPIVLITLTFYLVAIIFAGKDPYNDREFLIIFNLLLIGVLAIIFFSIAETSKDKISKINTYLLIALACITLIVNGIALSAIIFRLAQWGITPNRLTVLGGNTIIFIHLILVTIQLFKISKRDGDILSVERSITAFLPVYAGWTIIVTFLFPLIFQFK